MPSMRKGAGLPAAPLKNSQKSKIKWERKGKRPEWFTFARYGSSKNMDGLNSHPLWSAIRTGCQQHQRWFTFPQSHHSSHRYALIRLINANKKTALAFIFIHSHFNFALLQSVRELPPSKWSAAQFSFFLPWWLPSWHFPQLMDSSLGPVVEVAVDVVAVAEEAEAVVAGKNNSKYRPAKTLLKHKK